VLSPFINRNCIGTMKEMVWDEAAAV
jgi:hypothetical protein